MRIDKELGNSPVSKVNSKQVSGRVFQTTGKDVFVKNGTIKKTVLAASLGVTALSLKNLFQKSNAKLEEDEILNRFKILGIDEQTAQKISSKITSTLHSKKSDAVNFFEILKNEDVNVFNKIINNPDKIENCYAVASAQQKSYCIKLDDMSVAFSVNPAGKIFEKKYSYSLSDGSLKSVCHNNICDTDKYTVTTSVYDKDSQIKTKVIDSGVVADKNGLLHSKKEEIIYEDGKLIKSISTFADGSKSYMQYHYSNNKLSGSLTKIYDKNRKLIEEMKTDVTYKKESVEDKDSETQVYIKYYNKDYRNDTQSFTFINGTKGEGQIIKEVRTFKDKNTGETKKEVIEQSDIFGVLNSKIIDKNGNEKIESFAKKLEDGSVVIEKHFESLDGTKTDYSYKAAPFKNELGLMYEILDKDGNTVLKNGKETKTNYNIYSENGDILSTSDINYNAPQYKIYDKNENILKTGEIDAPHNILKEQTSSEKNRNENKTNLMSSYKSDDIEMSYKVTDKDGNVLTTVDRKYKRLSPSSVYSSINGIEYIVTSNDKGLSIKNVKTEEVKTVKYQDILANVNDKSKNMLQSLSADIIFSLLEKNTKIDIIDDMFSSISIPGLSVQSGEDLYVLSHEVGHAKDFNVEGKCENIIDLLKANVTHSIANNTMFRKVYEEEKAAFMENLSKPQKAHIHYFIDDFADNKGFDYSPAEVIAESNAILSTGIIIEKMSARSHYLQKYFPKSIAMASKLLNQNNNIAQI